MPHRLSKSRYTAGIQCHKLLWWKVHEPLAVELQPDKVLQDRFDQGAHVGTLVRGNFPGGVLVDLPHHAYDERIKLTRKLIDEGAPETLTFARAISAMGAARLLHELQARVAGSTEPLRCLETDRPTFSSRRI